MGISPMYRSTQYSQKTPKTAFVQDDTGPSLSLTSRKVSQSLTELYTYKDYTAVPSFVEQHSFLLPVLFEAHSHIRRYFPDAPLVLRVRASPEGPDDDQLVVEIQPVMVVDEALDKLHKIGDDWWLENMSRSEHRLLITISPRGEG